MSKLIALKSGTHELLPDAWNSDFSNLKQQALLFDQIGIFKLSHFYETLEKSSDFLMKFDLNFPNKAKSIITELEWLNQIGIIFELSMDEEFKIPQEDLAKITSTLKFEDASILFMKIIEIQKSISANANEDTIKANFIKEQYFTILRLMSIIMEITKGVTAVTTFPYIEYTRELPNFQKASVAQIIINKLPLPNNETPWEKIIDYRNDSANQKSLLSLKRWIRKISNENLLPAEIEEELEWLTNEFQSHMKLHKMKANMETLEIIIKTPFETMENLLKLNFSKISNPLFALKKRQINLMEAELNAPGREMAYIIKTKDNFQSEE